MPRRVPRRFAKPFIVTVAAAASMPMAACEETIHTNPPRPRDSYPEPSTSAPQSSASAPAASASASASAVAPARDRRWALTRDDQKKNCFVAECDNVERCDAPTTAYDCPADVHHYPTQIISSSGGAMCRAIWHPHPMSCPPGASCNPPPPEVVEVPCPK